MNSHEKEELLKRIDTHNFEELNELKFELERILGCPNTPKRYKTEALAIQKLVNAKINTLL